MKISFVNYWPFDEGTMLGFQVARGEDSIGYFHMMEIGLFFVGIQIIKYQ